MVKTLILTDVGLRSDDGRMLFEHVNVRLESGELLVIAGPSGSGRSVLLEICAGLVEPTCGTVAWNDAPLSSLFRDQLLHMRRGLGFMFQTPALIANMTVYDNVALPLRYHTAADEDEIRDLVNERLHEFNLEQVARAFPETLTLRQAKSVAFVRALILDPDLVLLDEPTAGLDDVFERRLVDTLIRTRRQRPVTTVLATNDAGVMQILGGHVAMLSGATLSAFEQGTPLIPEFLKSLTAAYEQTSRAV